jgi:hypothetical protein
VLRWLLDNTRMSASAGDNGIAASTAYEYRDEGIAVLAAHRPPLDGVLPAADAVGHSQVIVDDTLGCGPCLPASAGLVIPRQRNEASVAAGVLSIVDYSIE